MNPTLLRIHLSHNAAHFLQKIPKKHAQQITKKIDILAADTHHSLATPLKGYEHFNRAKSGEYRIIFYVKEEILYITLIGKRNDDAIYKELLRSIK